MTAMKEKIDKPVFHTVGAAADSLGRECYVVGGYVRDLMLGRESKDIDFVTVGSGIEVARAVSRQLRGHLAVYKNFGTAQVKKGALELEFVGARKAFKRIRRTGVDKETIYTCYVTDSSRHLIGVTTVKELLLIMPIVAK